LHIAQFFPSLNYCLLSLILDNVGFNSRISNLFCNYLINRQIQYIWNNFVFPFFRANVGADQGLALFLILFTLYIMPILSYLLFLCLLFHLLIIVSLFLRKKAMKNQTQIYFVVIALFSLFSNNLVL